MSSTAFNILSAAIKADPAKVNYAEREYDVLQTPKIDAPENNAYVVKRVLLVVEVNNANQAEININSQLFNQVSISFASSKAIAVNSAFNYRLLWRQNNIHTYELTSDLVSLHAGTIEIEQKVFNNNLAIKAGFVRVLTAEITP